MNANTTLAWNPKWNGLPLGEFDPALEEETNIRTKLLNPWYPFVSFFDQDVTPYLLAFGSLPINLQYLQAYAEHIKNLSTNAPVIDNRQNAVLWHFGLVGFTAEGEESYHPIFKRPVFGLNSMVFNLQDYVEMGQNNFKHMPGAMNLLWLQMREAMRNYPTYLKDCLESYLHSGSVGISGQEHKATIESLTEALESRKPLWVLWKAVNGNQAEFQELWQQVENALREALALLQRTPAIRKGSWGEIALQSRLDNVAINLKPSEVCTWAHSQFLALKKVMNEMAGALMPGSLSWQYVWEHHPLTLPSSDKDLLKTYKKLGEDITKRCRKAGLLPKKWKDGHASYLFTPKARENDLPTAACWPAGKFATKPGKPRTSIVRITKTHGDVAKMREHAWILESLMAHERAAHGEQGFAKVGVLYLLQAVWRLNIYAYEGHAFSGELRAWKYSVIKRNLQNLFAITRERLMRALRVYVEYSYHMGLMSEEEVIELYSQETAMPVQMAQRDCNRMFAEPGTFSPYYVGAALAEAMLKLSPNDEVQTLREWLVETAAQVPAHMFAYMRGWVDSPLDVDPRIPDPIIAIWESEKDSLIQEHNKN